MGRLLLLFIALPALELGLLVEIGTRIGTLATVALIVVTGTIGAALARHQGLGVLREVQREAREGRLPAAPLLDGVLVLLAGALLVTPGILTDAAGFLCLVPAVRRRIRGAIRRRLERAAREGRVVVVRMDEEVRWPPPPAWEIEPDDRDPRP